MSITWPAMMAAAERVRRQCKLTTVPEWSSDPDVDDPGFNDWFEANVLNKA